MMQEERRTQMRLIDAEQCPCNNCVPPGDSRVRCSIFPCREFTEWHENTIYDVDKVVDELQTAPYYHGECGHIETDEAIEIVKRGGINENIRNNCI